jgi:hypothetical protein
VRSPSLSRWGNSPPSYEGGVGGRLRKLFCIRSLVKILDQVNNQNAKKLLLYLNKHSDRYWTSLELKEELNLDLEVDEIQKELVIFGLPCSGFSFLAC